MSLATSFARRLRLCAAPPSIKSIARLAGAGRLRVLDVGCGFGSAQSFKHYLPDCEYHGIDRTRDYLRPGDVEAMHRFYLADLESDSLDEIPERRDLARTSH